MINGKPVRSHFKKGFPDVTQSLVLVPCDGTDYPSNKWATTPKVTQNSSKASISLAIKRR